MIRVRRGVDRGHFDHGWLDTYHTFSFGRYVDRSQMGFRALRVLNEDRIGPDRGFGTHPHEDMEIVTYVLDGAIAHRDSTGGGGVLKPGELQHMSAGTGIEHSEYNPSPTEPVHLYQVWLIPEREGLPPSYSQRAFDVEGRRNRWQLVASPEGAGGSLTLRCDARILLADLDEDASLDHDVAAGRHAWLQVLRGEVLLAGERLVAGDGAAVSDEEAVRLLARGRSEVMLFDLA